MNAVIKNTSAVIIGAVGGSIVNAGIIILSSSIIPPPKGADVTTIEGLKASMHLFQTKHFIMPFLAHGLGTFAGALLASAIGINKMRCAIIVGVLFLLGGVSNIVMLPSPVWFNIVDIVFAYIPIAYFASKIIISRNTNS